MKAQLCLITSTEAMKTRPAGCVLFAAQGTKTSRTSLHFSTMETFTTEHLKTFLIAPSCWCGMMKIIQCIWVFLWEIKSTPFTHPAHLQLLRVSNLAFGGSISQSASQHASRSVGQSVGWSITTVSQSVSQSVSQ